ncbi:hypothetical protein CYG68_21020, partial [Morganella morganii]|nr:hypothetical protein [Morganella morganii]
MKKIGDVTSTADKNGEWTNGNVAAGIAPTILEAGWLNSVQREILGVIIAAGMQQDKNDDTQLSKAISKIISGGDYATKTEVNSKLAKNRNGADIPDKAAFINNLGLEEKFQPKGNYFNFSEINEMPGRGFNGAFSGGVGVKYVKGISVSSGGQADTGQIFVDFNAVVTARYLNSNGS